MNISPPIIELATALLQYGLGNLPADFHDFFTFIENNHDYATRSAFANAYIIPPVCTKYGILDGIKGMELC